jgi:hypothetical protein
MKNKRKVAKKLEFPIEGKLRIASKEQYQSILSKLYSLGYEFQSGKEYSIDDIPIGVSWELATDLDNKPFIRKTKLNRVLINYETDYIDLEKHPL